MKKIAVVLSGCGYLDGAEITESVSTLISLSELGADYTVFAPDDNLSVVNHNTSEGESAERNILAEAARISRGNVKPLTDLKVDDFDALVMPGGFGAAKNLSKFATAGSGGEILLSVKEAIQGFHAESKPVGAICISPALVAMSLGDKGVELTIGNDKDTAAEIEKTGAVHVDCEVTDYVTDRENKVITTPAYMYDAKPHEVFTGIRNMLKELVEMA